ncbi:MAG: tRNA (adenosine(37)-N6)-threonylcarbamoyltransferase complex ATPase subunit type 1 TsaE [Epsilonproteobacteria bacterium]|nr:tRNA (adenosine(37)-N6)-threonylcarbamoyltransferase complex ATPase subunit type 1 TsaE [Campylobacterota bacterium]
MKKYELSLDALHLLVEDIHKEFKSGVIILQGDLASGKTTLVKAFALHLNLKEEVTSPTFSLQQCYGDKLYHYDIYNHGIEHFISLGLLEELEKDVLHLVEWGDEKLVEILTSAGIETLIIKITKVKNNTRRYEVYNAQA